jgi:lactoylglutathione lyase
MSPRVTLETRLRNPSCPGPPALPRLGVAGDTLVDMLRKIDCVMIRVADVAAATDYYVRVMGLRRLWSDADGDHQTVGLGFPETDAELVLHDDPAVPGPLNVHYLVEDVRLACQELARQGCTVRVAPFEIAIGWCALLDDPFGAQLCILDMSKGPRQTADG